MRIFGGRGTVLWLVLLLILSANGSLFAQASGTLTGRVVDNSGAVVAGARVTATNLGTELARTTTTNGDGLYTITSLDPSTYNLKVEASGFASSERKGLTLIVGTTLTFDFTMGVAGVSQQVVVTGEAPTVETTQAEAAGSIETNQVQNLPIINRNFTGLVQLLPGARTVVPNPTKVSAGAISFSGLGRSEVNVLLDGVDDRDMVSGGPLMNVTNEAIEEFTVLLNNYSAQYGNSDGTVLNVVTKSGTNQFHGSAFGIGRWDALTSIDHFTKISNLPKTPYNREQYGGSFGGPIIKNRAFFSLAVERPQYDQQLTIPNNIYTEMIDLQQLTAATNSLATQAGQPGVGTTVVPIHAIPQTYRDLLSMAHVNIQLNNAHSLAFHFLSQNNNSVNDQFLAANHDLSAPSTDTNDFYTYAGAWNWIISPTKLNQFTIGRLHYHDFIISGPSYTSPPILDTLAFPAFNTGRLGVTSQEQFIDYLEIKDGFSDDIGKHALKFGGEFFTQFNPFGVYTNAGPGSISFFQNPSTILASYNAWHAGTCGPLPVAPNLVPANSPCGVYPYGLSSIGAVSNLTESSSPVSGGLVPQPTQYALYIQDDWKVTPRLTLNLGLRYDLSHNLYAQSNFAQSRVDAILTQISIPVIASYAGIPHDIKDELQPRVGFAWDIAGNAKHVIRGGFGIFFTPSQVRDYYQALSFAQPTIGITESFPNSGAAGNPSAGSIETSFQYGVTPLTNYGIPTPQASFQPTALPAFGNTTGYAVSPSLTHPYSVQFHIGYAAQYSENTSFSIDYTHFQINHVSGDTIEGDPIEVGGPANPATGAGVPLSWDPNAASYDTCGAPPGARRMFCALQALGLARTVILNGKPTPQAILASVPIVNSLNRERYNGIAVQFQHRFNRRTIVRVSYAYSRDYLFGPPLNPDDPTAAANWGPNVNDQPHTLAVFGIFNLPWEIQVSPIMQAGSGRPYNLLEGSNYTGDGTTTNDRYIPQGSNTPVTYDSQRGNSMFMLDMRGTKIFNLDKDGRRTIAAYVELYNVTNKVNLGPNYGATCAGTVTGAWPNVTGNACGSSIFEQPTGGYLTGLGYTRQMQLGARFTF